MTDKKKTPPDNTGKKYDLTITDKQIKFIDLYCSKYGELSATDCAIRAGYSRTSAYQRAHELLNPRLSPATAKIIQDRLQGNMEVWLIDKEKHLANLHRIQQDAKAKGQYGVAGKMEELKGKVQGFYVERNLNLNVEQKQEDTKERIRRMYDREDYETEAARKEKAKKLKEDEAAMKELEEYQEMRTRERNRKLGLDRKKIGKFDG